MQTLKSYLEKNRLYINTDKTHYMTFNSSSEVNIMYNNIRLQQTDRVKFLGWTLDSNFKFTAHVSNLAKNLSKSFSFLKIFKKYPIKIRKTLFFSFIDRHLKFSSPILINIDKSGINSIECKYKKHLTS